uniref:Phospholipid phosphatase 4 n=1 Tax=Accipiter nisus TaxID=211598 RepID=A0A8B9N6H6_9AVES
MTIYSPVLVAAGIELIFFLVVGTVCFGFSVRINFTEFLDPFQRVIQPEEIWLYKNPLVQSDNIPTRLMFAISFLTPLAVIFVVKIIRRTDKTEIKEAFLGNVCHTSRQKIPRPDFFYRCFPDGVMNSEMHCTGDPDLVSEGRKSFPSIHSSYHEPDFCRRGLVICVRSPLPGDPLFPLLEIKL